MQQGVQPAAVGHRHVQDDHIHIGGLRLGQGFSSVRCFRGDRDIRRLAEYLFETLPNDRMVIRDQYLDHGTPRFPPELAAFYRGRIRAEIGQTWDKL
jgi:hypothetical protein